MAYDISQSRTGEPKRSTKQIQITTQLRTWIVEGRWLPDGRLPTRVELCEEMSASTVTIQAAIDQLMREGFLRSQGVRGTFVVSNPPHLCCYALVFPSDVAGTSGPKLWNVLAHQAALIGEEGPRHFQFYRNVDGRGDSEDYHRLIVDIRARRLAGVIFASTPDLLQNTPLLDEPGIPRAAVMSVAAYGIPGVSYDTANFHDRALDYLATQGRRRIAVLSMSARDGCEEERQLEEHVRDGIVARGMAIHPYWFQCLSEPIASRARACIHLLMHDGQNERPDALIVTDDTLLEYATAGLIDAGVRVPKEVEVISLCNFPQPPRALVPVKYLGFDARQALATLIEQIETQRRGEKPVELTLLPAVFENEVAPAPSSRCAGIQNRS